jgi:hypothetical protein
MVWTGPPTNNPPRDDKKYWIRGKLDSTEMHNGSMRANVMTAKGMYNPELSRVFNADMSEAYTPSPAKPFRNPPGFNKQGTGVGNRLAQQTRDELANTQPSKGTPVPAKDFTQGVLKDLKKVNVKEAPTDYSKRRQRERDVDAGKPVAKQRPSKMTDYQKRRAQQKKEMELGEEKTRLDPKCWTGKKIGNPKTKIKGGVRVNNCVPAESVNEEQDTSGVERAILNRIMVAHTDLLMKFGP